MADNVIDIGGWDRVLPDEVKARAAGLMARAKTVVDGGEELYPPNDKILRALQMTPPEAVKAVIVGQDPYHTPGQADGLAFSVSSGNGIQPSLRNIFHELETDLRIKIPDGAGDLSRWAENGVLLLNTSLTVYRGRPDSCRDWGWDAVTSGILETVILECPQPVVFVCWGAKAIRFFQDASDAAAKVLSGMPCGQPRDARMSAAMRKFVVKSSHPSPFSADKATSSAPAFLGSRPFSAVNDALAGFGAEPVDWSLE